MELEINQGRTRNSAVAHAHQALGAKGEVGKEDARGQPNHLEVAGGLTLIGEGLL